VAAAVGNAVSHALAAHDISITELPITPDRLRKVLRAAGA